MGQSRPMGQFIARHVSTKAHRPQSITDATVLWRF